MYRVTFKLGNNTKILIAQSVNIDYGYQSSPIVELYSSKENLNKYLIATVVNPRNLLVEKLDKENNNDTK